MQYISFFSQSLVKIKSTLLTTVFTLCWECVLCWCCLSDVVMGFVSTPLLMALRCIFFSLCFEEEEGTWRHRHVHPAVVLHYFIFSPNSLNNSSVRLQMTRGPYDQQKQSAGWLRLWFWSQHESEWTLFTWMLFPGLIDNDILVHIIPNFKNSLCNL